MAIVAISIAGSGPVPVSVNVNEPLHLGIYPECMTVSYSQMFRSLKGGTSEVINAA